MLATGLLASTSIQVLANETEKVDTSKFETVNLQDALNNVKNELTSIEDLQMIVANIPAGLFTNNIFALSTNIEKINNPNAKLALQKNLEKAIAKYEEKTAEETTEEDSVTETPVVVVPEEETEVEKSVPETEEAEKAEKQVADKLKKAEREAAKAAEKAAKLVEKQERKAAQQAKKEERKAAQQTKKEERKAAQQVKKEEHKENKANKKEAKDQK